MNVLVVTRTEIFAIDWLESFGYKDGKHKDHMNLDMRTEQSVQRLVAIMN